ncbi:MAG: 6-aminohexanoate hydrolase [Actinomycetia bacterium]|nr:6-aminohexanoate hydrolase [Actinomycetes bacterium]
MDELLDGDATGLAAAIRRGEVSADEVLKHTLARMAERDPAVQAVAEPCPDILRAHDGPLAGVPFVVKDLGVDVAGMHSRGGSRLFADRVATADSEVVARYRRAGLVVVATTKTPELGRNASTEPVLGGPARNPHRLTHSPGGSSGGTAAAVAAGMVTIGHGNDGGGSIRIPASMCGLVGLKPTRGRVPAFPRRTSFSYPVSINHVLTTSVRDSALVLDLTAGPLPGDPQVTPPPARPYIEELGAPTGRLRIALATNRPDGGPVHPDCVAATEGAAALLESLGHVVEPADLAWPADAVRAAMVAIMSVPMATDIDARLAELDRPMADDDLEAMTRFLYDGAKAMPGTAVIVALQELERAAHALGAIHATYDLLLTPTMAQPVPPLGLLDMMDLPAMFEHAGGYSAFTGFANVTGQPAISLPLATDSTGLPVGVQLVAAFGGEDVLLRVASQVEAAAPWSTAPVYSGQSSST